MSALYVVSTPIGNLMDLSHRAVEVLGSVSIVYAEDTRRTRALLERFEISTPLRSLTEHNEPSRTREILDRLAAGASVALVSDAGTPLVSDPGTRLVRAVIEEGGVVVPVPGASAVLAALVASGLPAVPFHFLGFLPKKGGDRAAALDRIAGADATVVLFESPARLDRLLQDLEAVCGPDRELAVGREITKLHEEFVRGTLAEARAYYDSRPARGEVTVVVGPRARGRPEVRDDAELAAAARDLLDRGLTPKDVVAEVIERFDIPRNRAYRLVQTVAER